jgi:hypothetical protein
MSCTVTEGLAIWAAVFVTIRLLIKWGWSDDAIYTNYRRMMAQRTALRISHNLNPVQLQVLTDNAEYMRVAMEKLSVPVTASFKCPWGDETCPFYEDHCNLRCGRSLLKHWPSVDDRRKAPIKLVIGSNALNQNLYWVYHVVAVCAEIERRILHPTYPDAPEPPQAVLTSDPHSYLHDETRLIIF